MQVAVTVGIISIGNKNNQYCSTAGSRLIYTSNATLLNPIVALSTARQLYLDQSLAIYYGNTGLNTLGLFCW